MAVSNSTGKSILKYDDVRDLILAKEVRKRDSGETSCSSSALNVDYRGRSHDKNSNRAGHIKRNCRNPKKTENDSANVVTEEVHDALLLVVHCPVDDWILDSRASFHTSYLREIMQNYVAGDFGKVYLADGEALNVVGMGDIDIAFPNKNKWTLQKVRHIFELKKNLISVGQLDDCSHSVVFSDSTWKVTKGTLVLARGKKNGTLYSTTGLKNTICYYRYRNHVCVRVALWGEQKKVIFFKGGRTLKKEKLDLVHTDVWGPSPVASLGGSCYYVMFIDDHSRKSMVETETGLKLKCLRFDNGGEYIDGGFKEYCAARGIRMEKTIPGTPQQNEADAVSNAVYLINRGSSAPLDCGLHEEAWSGKEDKSRKIIRSRNVIFDEKIVYKDKSSTVAEACRDASDGESGSSAPTPIIPQSYPKSSTHAAAIHRSVRTIHPPQHFSPTLNYILLTYILLTNGGEPQKLPQGKNPTDMLTKGVTLEKLKLCVTSSDSKSRQEIQSRGGLRLCCLNRDVCVNKVSREDDSFAKKIGESYRHREIYSLEPLYVGYGVCRCDIHSETLSRMTRLMEEAESREVVTLMRLSIGLHHRGWKRGLCHRGRRGQVETLRCCGSTVDPSLMALTKTGDSRLSSSRHCSVWKFCRRSLLLLQWRLATCWGFAAWRVSMIEGCWKPIKLCFSAPQNREPLSQILWQVICRCAAETKFDRKFWPTESPASPVVKGSLLELHCLDSF
ncbi:uncharacterized protein [Aristolochia californica]|uniref:uncharacterized protein n=1 Tax=Aristolochia californica TaxID=171875 RepID=UPI0035DDBBE6